MNTKKILAGAGTSVLALATIFAVKANNHKPTVITTVFYTVSSACKSFSVGTPGVFTTASAGTQATIRTVGGSATRKNLWGTCDDSGGPASVANPIHFNP